MSHNEAIESLNIEIWGVQCVTPVLWATNQASHDMIIGNNFQRLYSPCTQTKTQIIFTINDHSVPIDKLIRHTPIKKLSLHTASVVRKKSEHNAR